MSASLQIQAAFPNAKLPYDGPLFAADGDGADEVFHGRFWQEIDPTDLDFHSSALRLFTPRAFAYFLPGFMLASLAHENLGITDVVIDNLCPPKNDPDRPSFLRRWSQLTEQQRQAVIAYLRYFEVRNPLSIRSAVAALEAAHAG